MTCLAETLNFNMDWGIYGFLWICSQRINLSLIKVPVRAGSRMGQVAIYNAFYLLVPSIFQCFQHVGRIHYHLLHTSFPFLIEQMYKKSHGIFPTVKTISPRKVKLWKLHVLLPSWCIMMGRYDKVGQAAPIKSATLEIIKIPSVLKGSPSQAVVCENGSYPLKSAFSS